MRRFALILCGVVCLSQGAAAQTTADSLDQDSLWSIPLTTSRVTFGIAMGVCGISAQDIVSIINQEMGTGVVSTNSFASAGFVEGTLSWRFADRFDVAVSQGFVSKSYSFGDIFSGATFYSYDLTHYKLAVHRTFVEDLYSVGFGIGGGYLSGVLRRTYSFAPSAPRLTASGEFVMVEVVARTPFWGRLFLHTSLHGAITFSAPLRDEAGKAVRIFSQDPHDATFSSTEAAFAVGFDYCF